MTELPYGNPLPPDFVDGEELSAAEFNAVKNYWVTDELPEEAEDGDVVFVIESDPFDPNATPGLPGIGGWATIESISGFSNKVEKDGYTSYTFTDDGSFVVSESGLVECVLVGPGSNGARAQAGMIADGYHLMPQDTLGVEVGRYNPYGTGYPSSYGVPSRIFTGDPFTYSSSNSTWHDANNNSVPLVYAAPGIMAGSTTYPDWGCASGRADWRKDSTWATADANGFWKGYESDISGEMKTYSEGNINSPEPNSGSSGNVSNDNSAFGVVIIRIPTENAPATARENKFSWTYIATLDGDKVVEVTRTNISSFSMEENQVVCPSGTGEGWNYDGSEFTAPEPDNSELIKQLEEQLQTLRGAK
jgi:hypothetical protein